MLRLNAPRNLFLPIALLTTGLLLAAPRTAQAEAVTLAENGKARLAISIPQGASEDLQSTAGDLATMLGRITGGEFSVKQADVGQGIRLRVTSDETPGVLEREPYRIRSHSGGLELSGSTDLAVRHAVWDLLYRLGYRQFFPGKHWEVVPHSPTLRVDLDVSESPDYHYRRIWYGFGTWDHNAEPYRDWVKKNRMDGGFDVRSGHAYGGIIRGKKAVFDEHPEYYALVNGKRNIHPQAKLCISNPGLRETVVDYAREYFRTHPEEDCISMDPSDGGGWCECEHCRKIGPPSDRALLLANQVARAVNSPAANASKDKPQPKRYVGMYAYAYHSPPPSLDVDPHVIINTATAFIRGGLSIEGLISGWSEKGATIGIREYYSVSTWDRDLPGAARGSNLDYLARTIPDFHARGARFLNSESSDNWGCNGLGYYFASRALWDLDAAKNREAIIEDFLEKSFGPAREPMRKFYALIDGSNSDARLVYEDLLARMYRLLHQARQQVLAAAGDSGQEKSQTAGYLNRINDLILYTHYVDRFDRYRKAQGDARQQAYEAMIRHMYRMRGTMMIHAKALYRDVDNRDRSVSIPAEAEWSVPEAKNPWKSSEPFSTAEMQKILTQGIADHEPVELGFKPRSFSDELVSASPLKLPTASPGGASRGRGTRSWYTRVDEPGEIVLNITGGLIAHYRDRGNVKVSLWQIGGASQTGERETLVAEDRSVPPDGKERTIRLKADEPGLYRIDLNDGSDLTAVTWPDGQPMTWKMSLDDHPRSISGRWGLHFHVPPGTKTIGLYAKVAGGYVIDPAGRKVHTFEKTGGRFVSIPVPEGMDGTLWKLNHIAGTVCLMNVPPYLARTAEELLLPEEVVKK